MSLFSDFLDLNKADALDFISEKIKTSGRSPQDEIIRLIIQSNHEEHDNKEKYNSKNIPMNEVQIWVKQKKELKE